MRAEGVLFRCHSFEGACADLDIEHRLTKPRHPWTNGQVERMTVQLRTPTVRRFYYDSHDQLRQHLADFVRLQLRASSENATRPSRPTRRSVKPGRTSPSGSNRSAPPNPGPKHLERLSP